MLRGQSPGRTARGALLGVLLAAGAGAAPAVRPAPRSGSGGPRVVALVVGLDAAAQGESGLLQSLALAELWRSARFEPARLVDALDPTGTRFRAARREEGDEAMRLGRKAYDEELDTQKAQGLFERAMKAFELTDLSLSHNFEAYVQAWTMKLAAQVANAQARQAEKELDRLLAIAPRAVFSPNYFPPELIARAERLRRSVAALAQARLEVTTMPGPADIYVDGQFRGRSPVTVQGLVPGEHFVSALATGGLIQQQRVREGKVELALRPAEAAPSYQQALGRIRGDPAGKERDQAAAQFGRTLGVEQVLLVLARKSTTGQRLEMTALRLDAWDTHNLGYRVGTVPLDDGLQPAFAALLAPVVSHDEPRRDGQPVSHYDSGLRWTTRTTGYVLLGTGVALLAGGAYFGFQALNNDPNHNVQSVPIGVDVALLVGLAAAGTGGVLAFAPEKKEDEAPPPAPALEPSQSRPPPSAAPPLAAPPPGATRPSPAAPPPPASTRPAPAAPPPAATRPAPAAPPPAATRPAPADPSGPSSEELKRQEEERRRREAQLQEERRRREAQQQEEERRRREAEKKKTEDDDLRNF